MKNLNSPIALIPIDIQKGFLDTGWGNRNNPHAENQMAELIHYWRMKRWPIFHVQHLSRISDSPLNPKSDGVNFMDFAVPNSDEYIFQKNVNSGFIGTDLEASLHQYGIKEVVCMGFTTDHCVSTTARMAANLGFKVLISADAVVTFDRKDYLDGSIIPAADIQRTALASLNGEFAKVFNQDDLLKYLEIV